MVLPEPAAHDASPQAAGWVDEIALSLGMSRAGALVLVDHAHLARLGDLVRTLRHTWPELEVHAGVESLEQTPTSGTIVLVPRPEDATWLNLRRQPFAERKLKVVLWCDEATAAALARHAVDFFDWISHRQECPPGPVPFAVNGIRAAFNADWPVVWTGSERREDLEEVIRNALPDEPPPFWLAGSASYEELVSAMSSSRNVVVVRVESARQLWRVRWARAESFRRSKVIVVAPGLDCPGFWPVHDRVEGLVPARARLAKEGARAPGCLAALLDLEPEAIALAATLLEKGANREELERAVTGTMDPGAGLSLWAEKRWGLPLSERYFLDVSPPVLRGIAPRPRAKAVFEAWQQIDPESRKEDVSSMQEVGVWAAHAQRTEGWKPSGDPALWPWEMEVLLRGWERPRIFDSNLLMRAAMAASLGCGDVAKSWIERPVFRRMAREATVPETVPETGLDLLGTILGKSMSEATNPSDASFLLERIEEAAKTVDRTLDRDLLRLRGRMGAMVTAALGIGGLVAFTIAPSRLFLVAILLLVLLLLLATAAWFRRRARAVLTERSQISPVRAFVSAQRRREEAIRSRLSHVRALVSSEAFEEAEPLARETARQASEDLGDHHPLHDDAVGVLISVLVEQGRSEEALALMAPHVVSAERDFSVRAARILADSGRAMEAVEALWWLVNGERAPVASGPASPAGDPVPPSEEAPLLAALLRRPEGSLTDQPEAHLVLVDALLKQGRYPEALRVANNAVSAFRDKEISSVRILRERRTDLQRRLGVSV